MMRDAALASENTGPLAGLRVLDMTSVVFGAYAAQMLGDLGADVIKVEFPAARAGGGDLMRWTGRSPDGSEGFGPIFMTVNRNKRSLLLDLRKPDELAALKALIPTCDALVTSVRMRGLERLGLDYQAVAALRPDIVYAHAAGYGAEGPYAGEPAYDDLIQAASGMSDLLPRTDGDPTPRYMPALIADKVSGLFMAQAALAALFHRQRTGEGQFVEVPMMECLTSFTLVEHQFGHVFDPPTGDWTYHRAATRHRRPYPTKDGWIGLLPYADNQWNQFFAVAGWTETVAADPRFATQAARMQHLPDLYALVDTATVTKTTQEWLDLLKPLSIPVTPLNRLDDLYTDPHLDAVGLFERRQHPQAGAYVAVRPPVRYAATPATIRRHPPALGEHNDELLAELGLRTSP